MPQAAAPIAAAQTTMRAGSVAQGEAAEVDEPVRRWDEQRQVVQPVVVDAPDERARHLPDRREEDDANGLCPHERRKRPECGRMFWNGKS